MSDEDTFELPDGVDRCPTCGRFVPLGLGYGDIANGGLRGEDLPVDYCDERCARGVLCAHGHAGTEADPCRSQGCSQ